MKDRDTLIKVSVSNANEVVTVFIWQCLFCSQQRTK